MAARLLLIPCIFVAVALTVLAIVHTQRDLQFTRLDTELSFWGRDNYQPTDATRARTQAGINALLESAPTNASYLTLRASQLAWEGYWLGGDDGAALDQQALAVQARAQRSRPAYGLGWLYLLEYAERAGADEEFQAQARNRLDALRRWQ